MSVALNLVLRVSYAGMGILSPVISQPTIKESIKFWKIFLLNRFETAQLSPFDYILECEYQKPRNVYSLVFPVWKVILIYIIALLNVLLCIESYLIRYKVHPCCCIAPFH